MHSLVSILIPVYNREATVGDAILSAINQSYKHIEVIVVDNASTDGTYAICAKYANSDDRVKVFKNSENIGPVRNWIRCAEEAKGVACKFLFSDDTLDPSCIETMIDIMLNAPDVGLVFAAAKIGKSEDDCTTSYLTKKNSIYTQEEYLSLIIDGLAPVSPGATLVKREHLLNNILLNIESKIPRRYADHGAGPDVMISILALENGRRAVSAGEPLVFFRVHQGSFSIGELRGEVIDSYRSTIANFLAKGSMHSLLNKYLAREWLLKIKNDRLICNPIDFMGSYELDCNFTQGFLFFVNIFSASMTSAFSRLKRVLS